jgi:WD40 repeat protein
LILLFEADILQAHLQMGTQEMLDPCQHLTPICLLRLYHRIYAQTYQTNFISFAQGHFDGSSVSIVKAGHFRLRLGNDNPMLVSASGDKTLKIWDLRTYKEIRTLSDHQDEIYSVAVSSDTKHIISGGLDMIVRLWCFHTGKLLFCFKGHSQSVRWV